MYNIKFLKTLTAGVALATAIYPQAWAEIVDSGNCSYYGECKFELDDKGNLRIYGSGTIADYFATSFNTSHPKLATDVKNVVVEKGITGIGRNSFRGCSLESISLPNTLTTIGLGPFEGATNLHKIVIPKSVTSIGSLTTYSYLNDITIEGENLEIPEFMSLCYGVYSSGEVNFNVVEGSNTEKRLKELLPSWAVSSVKFHAYVPPKRTHYTIEEAMEHIEKGDHNKITFTFK